MPLNIARVFNRDFDLFGNDLRVNRVISQGGFGCEALVVHLHQHVVIDLGAAHQIRKTVLALDGFAQQRRGQLGGKVIRIDPGGFQSFGLLGNSLDFLFKILPLRITDQAQLAANRREARIGVVLAQAQSILGAAGEHAVWLGHALGD